MGASTMTQNKGEPSEKFLERLTHLHLQGRGLGPSLEPVGVAKSVYVLYAYDNMLSSLEGLQPLRKLQQLYLQHNMLTSMKGLECLTHLKKLHLGNNRLSRVEGLERYNQLEDLLVPRQMPSDGATLDFDAATMAAVAPTLRVLDAAGNRLRDVSALAGMLQLQELDLSENLVQEVQQVVDVVTGDCLQKVQLRGNPVTAQERKLRSAVVLSARSVGEIDGRAVLPKERDFFRRIEEQKQKLEVQRRRNLERGSSNSPSGAPPVATKAELSLNRRSTAPPTIQDLVH